MTHDVNTEVGARQGIMDSSARGCTCAEIKTEIEV